MRNSKNNKVNIPNSNLNLNSQKSDSSRGLKPNKSVSFKSVNYNEKGSGNNNTKNLDKTIPQKEKENLKDKNFQSVEASVLEKFNKANMLVVVRKRPLTVKESNFNGADLVKITSGDQVTLLDLNCARDSNFAKNPQAKNQHFFYDYAFGDETEQD